MGENLAKGVDPTFLNLKNQLATMYGASAVDDLQDIDAERVGIYVNQAYRECYAPMDGYRPSWASVNFGLNFPAPATISLALTNGSAESTTAGSAYSTYAGSFLELGSDFHVFAGLNDDGNIVLQTPWTGTTGTHSATLYYSSHELDREVIDIDGPPELVGFGAMSPINSPEAELKLRSSFATDFVPTRVYGNIPSINFNGAKIEKDANPPFYYVDNSTLLSRYSDAALALEDKMAVRPRFNVYPVPSEEINVRMKANVLPLELTANGDIAKLPGNVVWDILFPIACAKLALTDPRYNGDNREAVVMNANEARKRLSTLARPQKHRTLRLRKRGGW